MGTRLSIRYQSGLLYVVKDASLAAGEPQTQPNDKGWILMPD